jgi:hypothetical protein
MQMEGERSAPVLIGWKEYVEFPDWGLRHVRAKVDTGARTSALDTKKYELRQVSDGTLRARLVLRIRTAKARLRVIDVPVLGFVEVRSSNGAHEKRPLIETSLFLGGVVKRVRFTLACRSAMRFRVLLGRTALAPEFLVDVSQQYLQHRG